MQGGKLIIRGAWIHLPIGYMLVSVIMTGVMAMAYFTPSRPVLAASGVFPLFWVAVYLYARFSSEPDSGHTLKRMTVILGPAVVLLAGCILLLRPLCDSEVAVPLQTFFPDAHFDDAALIKDAQGGPLRDGAGSPLEQGKMVTVAGDRQYRLEGRRLVSPENKARITAGLEVSTALWTIALVLHCWTFRGRTGVIIFFGAALLYGFLLESGGVMLGFFRENDYTVYLPGLAAPAATMCGWALVIYVSVCTYEMIERRWPALRSMNASAAGLIIALIALFWDVNIDPVATGLGLWTWNESLPAWFLGVPLVNFTSWLSAVFVFGVGYSAVHRRAGWSDRKKIGAMFAMIPLLLLGAAIINFIILGLAEGFDGPAWQVLVLAL